MQKHTYYVHPYITASIYNSNVPSIYYIYVFYIPHLFFLAHDSKVASSYIILLKLPQPILVFLICNSAICINYWFGDQEVTAGFEETLVLMIDWYTVVSVSIEFALASALFALTPLC